MRIIYCGAAERLGLERALRRTHMHREVKRTVLRPPQPVENRHGGAG
jgi:hypothetical protein